MSQPVQAWQRWAHHEHRHNTKCGGCSHLRGGKQDDVECLHHGRGKAQVRLPIQDVGQGTEDLLGSQQQGELAQYEGASSLQEPAPQWPSEPA